MRSFPGPLVAAALFVVAIAAIVVVRAHPATSPERPFELVNSVTGKAVSDRDFRGKWLVVFFGYTHCPDICPTTLSELAETMSDLGGLATQVQPLFITVDPARDSASALVNYISAFDTRILGLTGTSDQIAQAATTFGARYWRREVDGDYFVDHTAGIYPVRPDGSYETSFLTTVGAPAMTASLSDLINSDTIDHIDDGAGARNRRVMFRARQGSINSDRLGDQR